MKCSFEEDRTMSEAGVQGREFKTATMPQNCHSPGCWTHWPFVECAYGGGFNYSNVSKATEDILNVLNVTDPICLLLCLHVSVIGTEIWNQGNLNVNLDMSQLLDNFESREVFICTPVCHVSGHLFVCKDFSNVFKLA